MGGAATGGTTGTTEMPDGGPAAADPDAGPPMAGKDDDGTGGKKGKG
jgi:hypothetical protein